MVLIGTIGFTIIGALEYQINDYQTQLNNLTEHISTHIQDIDRSEYKFFRGEELKYHVELLSEINVSSPIIHHRTTEAIIKHRDAIQNMWSAAYDISDSNPKFEDAMIEWESEINFGRLYDIYFEYRRKALTHLGRIIDEQFRLQEQMIHLSRIRYVLMIICIIINSAGLSLAFTVQTKNRDKKRRKL